MLKLIERVCVDVAHVLGKVAGAVRSLTDTRSPTRNPADTLLPERSSRSVRDNAQNPNLAIHANLFCNQGLCLRPGNLECG